MNIKDLTVHPKPQNNNAKVAFLITLLISAVGFAVYFVIEKYRGVVGMFALLTLVTAILFYTKYICPNFYYDITADSDGVPIFVVRQIIGKRQTTLCRIDLANIRALVSEVKEERRAHKTPSGYRKYVYAPTLLPPKVYRITVVGRYEKAEIIIECSDEFASYLSECVKEAENFAEEE
ncbi:MAG: hypothetical protein E7612_06200 [Ruminococcaceae bacterium]|nr:hypothetical protein [Oscillospiraceae bacterium]